MIWFLLALLLLAALYLFLIWPNWSRRPLSGFSGRHFAHRGLWGGDVPENSLEAFRRAAEAGHGIEMDVQLTRDDALVVFHDDDTARMCGEGGDIREKTLEEIAHLRLPNGEPIPSFDEVLKTVGGRVPLIIELKTCKRISLLCEKVYERLQRYDGLWCMESFDPRAVRWFRLHAPQVIRGQLVTGIRSIEHPAAKHRLLASLLPNILGRPDFIAQNIENDDRPTMRLMRIIRPHLVAWTVRRPEQWPRARQYYDLIIFEGEIPSVDKSTDRVV